MTHRRNTSRCPLRAIGNLACALAATLLLGTGGAQAAEALSGEIRIWGHGSLKDDYIGRLVSSWEKAFHQRHPGVTLSHTLRGNNSAIGGLYTGRAELAIMERGTIPIEIDGYEPIFKSHPLELTVATGSLDVPNHANALALLVRQDNPLRQLTLAQLAALFGAPRQPGTQAILRWGQLGVQGAWADKPIHLYVPAIDGDEAQFFEKKVMKTNRIWAAELKEFGANGQGGKPASGVQRAAEALAKDRYGLALSTTRFVLPGTRAVALAADAAGPFIPPEYGTLASRLYPLTRSVSVFIQRAPGKPVDPNVKEFVEFILSDEGQAAIGQDGGYYRLPSELARSEKEKLQ